MRQFLTIASLVVIWIAIAATLPIRDARAYEGVAPNSENTPPQLNRISKTPVAVTWPGFQMRADGGSRFFVQTSSKAAFRTRKGDRRFELVLKNARVHLRNNWHPLETQFFNTPVSRATVERRGKKDLAIVFELREDATPIVKQEAGKKGFHFVFVDFAKR